MAQHIYAVGETLLDIIFREGQPRVARPGGSSFNASVTLGRLGAPVTFISETGKDRVGDLIQGFMNQNGVNTGYIARYDQGQSAIALAFLDDRRNASYQFYKDYPQQRLAIEFPPFKRDDLLLFGSFYALNPEIRPRVRELLEQAAEAGMTILYDPNFRSSHASSRDELMAAITENMEYATIVRASDEDLQNIFGVDNPDDAWESVRPFAGVLVYTASSRGVYLRSDMLQMQLDVDQIEPVSTIGAGDTFNAGLLYGIWQHGLKKEQILNLDLSTWGQLIGQAIDFSREVCLSYDNYIPRTYAVKVKQNQ